MIRVGLTGSLGAGKSTVGRLFEAWGAERIDADELAREAVAPGSDALARVRAAFGDGVVGAEGGLDRAAVRRLVFADPEARARLEAIVHPEVERRRAARLAEARERGVRVAVVEVPLLFEKGLRDAFDVVVVVDAPPEVRRTRVAEARGLGAEEFAAIERAQMAPERKREAADHVIWNDEGPRELEESAREVWDAVTGATEAYERRAEGPPVRWRVDLHLHTSASHDCLSRPAEVVERARREGLDRIAVTDHDEIEGAFAARDIAPDLVIVGEEVRTAEGLDLIGLFLRERVEPRRDFRETAAAIRSQGGIVYVPHPFDARRGTTEEFLAGVADGIDAVEAFNARVHEPDRNRRAAAWAEARGLPAGAGSDAHLLREIGRGCCLTAPFAGPEDFCAALRGAPIEGRTSSRLVHLGSTWAKLRGRLPGGRR
ncbi:MAG: dephospho-CoA kinase [Gemmatimonadota bacterium]|nr:dephospho-CoA kinase [Gemmatimonadota bacterium]